MFTAGTTAEIFPCNSNFSGIVGGVQDEICFRVSLSIIPPVEKQLFAEPFPGGRFQKTGRNDLVGVYIFDFQWYRCGC